MSIIDKLYRIFSKTDSRTLLLDAYGRERAKAQSALDSYHGPERERVQLDILRLSKGSLNDLERWVARANGDYREVLSAAEYGNTEILNDFEKGRGWKDTDETSFRDL